MAWKIGDLRKKINVDSLAINHRPSTLQNHFFGRIVPEFSLPWVDGKGKFNFPEVKNSTYYLFIFFTPWDCYSCFTEVPFWQELKDKFMNRLNVIAVGTANSQKMLDYFVKTNDISIPTLFDRERLLFKALELADSGITPIKIMTTPKGVILHIKQTTRNDRRAQEEYLRLLDNLLP